MRIRQIICIKHHVTMRVGRWGRTDIAKELLPEMLEGCWERGILYLPADHPHLSEECILQVVSTREEGEG